MNRFECLQFLADRYRVRTYLEIGVRSGETFFRLRVPRKIGVDPVMTAPRRRARAIKADWRNVFARLVKQTSDEFFREGHRSVRSVDLAFIDGKHTGEQAYRDVSNVLAVLSPRGVIVVHDANPTSEAQAWPAESPEEAFAACAEAASSGAWCGDVWKAVVRLRVAHPNLGVFTLADDYGLAVLNPRLPGKPLFMDESSISGLRFGDLDAHRSDWLCLGAPEDFKAWIDHDPVLAAGHGCF